MRNCVSGVSDRKSVTEHPAAARRPYWHRHFAGGWKGASRMRTPVRKHRVENVASHRTIQRKRSSTTLPKRLYLFDLTCAFFCWSWYWPEVVLELGYYIIIIIKLHAGCTWFIAAIKLKEMFKLKNVYNVYYIFVVSIIKREKQIVHLFKTITKVNLIRRLSQ